MGASLDASSAERKKGWKQGGCRKECPSMVIGFQEGREVAGGELRDPPFFTLMWAAIAGIIIIVLYSSFKERKERREANEKRRKRSKK